MSWETIRTSQRFLQQCRNRPSCVEQHVDLGSISEASALKKGLGLFLQNKQTKVLQTLQFPSSMSFFNEQYTTPMIGVYKSTRGNYIREV